MEKSNSSRGTLSNNSKLRIQNSTLTLFPELHLSGEISDEVVVEPHHHLVCDDDVTFVPGSRLEIQPNAVVRIAPGADLTIMGNFKAQGEENNMFWVTSNDGFDVRGEGNPVKYVRSSHFTGQESEKGEVKSGSISHFTFPLSRESIELYNSMQLSPIATVVDDVIEWGKWDWGNTNLWIQSNNLTLQKGIFYQGNKGVYSPDLESISCINLLVKDFWNESQAGVYFNSLQSGNVSKNIIIDSYNGIKIKNDTYTNISNNYISNSNNGIHVSYYSNIFAGQNDIIKCENGIFVERSSSALIEENEIEAMTCIKTYVISDSDLSANYNNLSYSEYSIHIGYRSLQTYDCTNNYYYTTETFEIETSIFDVSDVESSQQQYYGDVVYEPFSYNKILEAGIN
jgi:hypothetical protein